jgi:hypothetical protein
MECPPGAISKNGTCVLAGILFFEMLRFVSFSSHAIWWISQKKEEKIWTKPIA